MKEVEVERKGDTIDRKKPKKRNRSPPIELLSLAVRSENHSGFSFQRPHRKGHARVSDLRAKTAGKQKHRERQRDKKAHLAHDGAAAAAEKEGRPAPLERRAQHSSLSKTLAERVTVRTSAVLYCFPLLFKKRARREEREKGKQKE